jgi:hypothetical protein
VRIEDVAGAARRQVLDQSPQPRERRPIPLGDEPDGMGGTQAALSSRSSAP